MKHTLLLLAAAPLALFPLQDPPAQEGEGESAEPAPETPRQLPPGLRPDRPIKRVPQDPEERTLEIGDIPLEELTGPERDEAEALLHVRLEEQYFLTCDANGNGWISYRESSARMQTDRDEYFLFDADEDGRIGRDEFGARYRYTVESVGSFRPPITPKSLFPTPEGSPLVYDFNASGALEERELSAFLLDKGIRMPVNVLFDHLDANESDALELDEFGAVVATLAPLVPDDLPLPGADLLSGGTSTTPDLSLTAPPATVLELFGTSVPREVKYGATPGPDRVPGPIRHFDRLDYDRSGFLEEEDLLDLLRPANVDVRVGAVVAALDSNGDGKLSRLEFEEALHKSNDWGPRYR
ncbi:MAG: EF-hand domain-containing protein [Planctomycetota bacterium]